MKQKNFFNCLLIAILLFNGAWLSMQAQTNVIGTCPGYCDPTSGGGSVPAGDEDAFYMLINTEANGDVTFEILGIPGNTTTFFRGNGWSDDRVQNGITVNGNPNTANVYFTRSINAEKTIITLHKAGDIPEDATIVINTVLEYKTANSHPVGLPGNIADLWPDIRIEFTYGTTCSFVQTQLDTPSITDIDEDKKITFASVANAGSYKAIIYRDAALVYEQIVTSGDILNFTPLITYNYAVKLKALSDDINYLDSDLSTSYTWYLEADEIELDPSEYCNHVIGTNNNNYAYVTWETNTSGDVVITISGYAGDTQTSFRSDGMGSNLNNFKVNGASADTYFTRSYTTGGSTFILALKEGSPIVSGDVISYGGTIEWRTGKDTNAYGSYAFPSYTYGTSCAGLPTVNTSPTAITFNPLEGVQTFTVSGENLTGDITINPPRGLTVTPATVSPDGNGTIEETTITVNWTEGTPNGSFIQITGGGLTSNVPVLVNTSGFSDYCNKILSFSTGGMQYPAYLTIMISEDKKDMIFDIAPVYGEVATWNANSLPAGQVLVNGVAPAVVPIRVFSEGNTRITLSFNDDLADNDVVSFGSPLVWTTANSNLDVHNNCFIDPMQTYTVGLSCELDKGPSTIESVLSDKSITAHPNPATNVIYFYKVISKASIYALSGQLVSTVTNSISMDVSSFARGFYILRITDELGNQQSTKVEFR